MATIQMVKVWIPMLDGRWLMLPRYTQPEKDVQAMLNKLDITLPSQPPPRGLAPRRETINECRTSSMMRTRFRFQIKASRDLARVVHSLRRS